MSMLRLNRWLFVMISFAALIECVVDARKTQERKKRKRQKQADELQFCGKKNCFTVLGLERENATPSVVKKTFYKLSKQYHPDRNPSADAAAAFILIGQAYEVIGDAKARQVYEEFLDYPERFFAVPEGWRRKHYFGKQENVWSVLLFIISAASVAEYFFKRNQFGTTRRILCADSIVQDRVRQLRAARGDTTMTKMASFSGSGKKAKSKLNRAPLDITDFELKEVVKMKGFSGPPSWRSVLVIRILLWPYNMVTARKTDDKLQ